VSAPVAPTIVGWLLVLLDAVLGTVFLISSRALESEM
jgi:hypothetical protein